MFKLKAHHLCVIHDNITIMIKMKLCPILIFTTKRFIEWNCSGKFLAIGSDKSQCKIVDVERDAVCCAPISMAPTGQGAHNFSRDPSTVSGEPLIPQTKSMYSPSSSLNGQNAGSVIKVSKCFTVCV